MASAEQNESEIGGDEEGEVQNLQESQGTGSHAEKGGTERQDEEDKAQEQAQAGSGEQSGKILRKYEGDDALFEEWNEFLRKED